MPGRPQDDDGSLWRALVEASPDVVLVLDPDGIILFANRVVPALRDRPIVGQRVWDLAVDPDGKDRVQHNLRRVVETRRALTYEAPWGRDGDRGLYEVQAVPVVVGARVERVVWSSRDITDRQRLEDQLRQSQKMEAIGLLAGGVAHDFNNLLAVILGFSELASRKLPPEHPVSAQLAEVFDAARRGSELTRKLLAFSRKQILQARPLDVRASVHEFTRLLSRIVGEDVHLVVSTPDEALVVRADSVQIEQVLLNLCTNARQAMPGGGTLRLAASAVTFDDASLRRKPWARAGRYAEIAVSDTGVGMDDATRTRIFEPFFTTRREGTGLGLSTVYGIVRQHGGLLGVESAPGLGTTFYVCLPLAEGDVAPAEPLAPAPWSPAPQGKETILVAEDEPSLRAIVGAILGELGYRVVMTSDGEEAVREYERRRDEIALVLLDVVMPGLDARQAYERVLALRPDARVLFMTGYAPESTRLAELLESGRVPVLEKPFTPQALAAKVRSALDG